jgi:protocatechuate 3,4-dioxygenase beta subunit
MSTLAACVLWLVASAVAEKPSARAESTPALTGTVTDTAGKPIVGALVLVRSALHAGDPPLSARTDDAGGFRLTPASSGPMDVRVEAPHFAPQELKAQQPGRPLRVWLAAGAWIAGVVRDGSTKAPIQGARVQAWAPRAGGPWEPTAGLVETRTDAQGRFRLDGLGPGRQVLRATARGYGAQFETSARPGTSVSFYLPSGAGVVGRVRDGQDRPLAGAVVEVEFPRSSLVLFEAAPRPDETDAEGRFEILGLQPGEYRLTARHRELAPAITTITLARGAVEQADLVLRPGVEVAGRLVDAEEKPVRGAVAFAEVDGQAAPSTLAEVSKSLAGDDGRFRMAHVPLGRHVLAVVAPGFTPLRVDVTVGANPVDVGDVRLESGLVIQGRVVDAGGTPVGEAELKAAPAALLRQVYDESGDRTARSDGDGHFLLGGLGEGTYEVTVEAYGFGRAVKLIDAGTRNATLALEPAGSIAGEVVDEGGRPLTDYRVVAQVKLSEDATHGFQRPYSQRVTAEDGRFAIDAVATAMYVLDVSSAEYEPASVDDVAVKSGAVTDVGRVVLRAGGIVRGTVVDGRDVPVAGAQVMAEPRSVRRLVLPPRTTTDGDGGFVLRGVAAGRCEVTVRHPSYAEGTSGTIDVDPERGPTDVRLVLTQGARVQGSVLARDGGPIPEATIVINPLGSVGRALPSRYDARTGPDGSFAIERVPPGQATVVLMADGGQVKTTSQTRTIELQEAQVATVDFVVRDIRIAGAVLRQQAPVPNATVRFARPDGAMMTSPGSAELAFPSPMRNTGVTGPDGRFELQVDGPGTYGVAISPADGQATHFRSVEIPDVESRDIEINLGDTVLSGVVLEEATERPLPAAQLSFHGGSEVVSAETDANGRFQVDLTPGRYNIRAELPEFAPQYLDIEVPAPGETRILLRRGDSLEGRVVDAAGRGAGDVTVRAFSVRPESTHLSAQSAADGTFSLTGLRRETYTLLADAGTSLRFAVAAGVRPGDSDVVLALRPAARLLVHVLAPDGKPVAGAHAQVEGIDGARVLYGVVRASDAAGVIEMAAPAGEVQLEVFHGMLSGKARVVAGPGATNALDVRLGPAEP